MKRVVFIGTFDPLHGGHIGQLMRAYKSVGFAEALILIDKHPEHKPKASSWQNRLKTAQLTMAAFNAPFEYKIMPVDSSLANEITEKVDFKITGIDSFIDNISDSRRWPFITRWPLIVLSIPGIEDGSLLSALQSVSNQLKGVKYTFVSEAEVPIMNYDFAMKKLTTKRVHSTYIRSGDDTPFIPTTTKNYIRNNGLYSSARS